VHLVQLLVHADKECRQGCDAVLQICGEYT
jgi:hypothetical protein